MYSTVRTPARFVVVSAVCFVLLLMTFRTEAQPIAPHQKHLKSLLKPTTSLFLAIPGGDHGYPCEGIGVCRAQLVKSGDEPLAQRRSAEMFLTEGRFAMMDGRLQFIITNITTDNAMSVADIRSFPFDVDIELPRESARALGFSGVQVFKSRYAASTMGVFPVLAKYSVGLRATAVATPANPNNRQADVSFEVLRTMQVSVLVLNASGERVATLMENTTIEGSETPQALRWNGMNDAGIRTASDEYRVEVRCVLPESGVSFAETAPLVFAPVGIAQR